MKMAIDIDGVLADFTNPYLDLIQRRLGVVIPRPPQTWNFTDGLVEPKALSAIWDEITRTDFF